MKKQPAVYILTNKKFGTLYTGVTSDLLKRIWQHKNHLVEGFSSKYKTDNLVWYELHETMISAIQREKNIKDWKRDWKRDWKIHLINKANPQWNDLYQDLL